MDLDGFEIAPAIAVKLNKYRFTPSPEKGTVALPAVGDGTIDLTDSPVKGSVDKPGKKESVSERPSMKNRHGSGSKKDSDRDVFSRSTPSTSKITTPIIQDPEDSDKTVVMDVDPAKGEEEKPEEVEKSVEEEQPLSAEQQKVLDMVMAG